MAKALSEHDLVFAKDEIDPPPPPPAPKQWPEWSIGGVKYDTIEGWASDSVIDAVAAYMDSHGLFQSTHPVGGATIGTPSP